MKYRWRNGKAQAISYVPALGRCVVVKEASSIHELYGYSYKTKMKKTVMKKTMTNINP